MKIDIRLQPKQSLVLDKLRHGTATYLGYGGARGGGKSGLVRRLAILIALECNIPVLLFRRLREELLNNHVYTLFEEYPQLFDLFNKSEFTLFRPDNPNKILIKLGYSEGEDEIRKFQGTEWGLIIVDEATQSTWNMIKYLKSCARYETPDWKPKLLLTFNPGGVGHTDIKTRFIDRIYRNENELPEDFDFVQSSVWDNAYWVEKPLKQDGYTVHDYYYKWSEQQRIDYCLEKADYAQNLKSQDEETRKAWLWGDWNVYGGLFFKSFRPKTQIIEPFEIPKEWKLFAGLDPGFSSPCAYLLGATDPMGNDYQIYTYDDAEKSAGEHAEAIHQLLTSEYSPIYSFTRGRMPQYTATGLDAWAKKDRYAILSHEHTFADAFVQKGIPLTRAVTDRVAGWRAIKTMFPERAFIFKGFNDSLIDEIMKAETEPKNIEDILGRGNNPQVSDHRLDAYRYRIMSSYASRKAQPEHKVLPNSRERAAIIHNTPNPIASF